MSDVHGSPRRSVRDSELRRRVISRSAIGSGLIALLVAGAVLPSGGVPAVAHTSSESLLPAVDLTTTAATVWNCPGPLPVTGGSTSSISITNPSRRDAEATVLVAETAVAPGAQPGLPLKGRVLDMRITAQSELDLPLSAEAVPPAKAKPSAGTSDTKSGGKAHAEAPTVYASVSVTVSGAGVAVSETVNYGAGILASPCAVGSAARGYTASGVTMGSSDVEVALFDPAAAPAVVNVSVGTGSGLVQPQAYQGLVIGPGSVAVLDLARWVPQRTHVAVSVQATVGRVVVGSMSSLSARFYSTVLGPAHSYEESGQELAVGIGQLLTRWLMPLGPAGHGDTEAVRIFDPGTRRALVTVRTSAAGVKPATMSVAVSPGQTVTVSAPVVSGATASALTSGGVVTVTSAGGVGIVVEHETYGTLTKTRVTLVSSSPTDVAAATWVLPGMVQSPTVDGQVSLTDAGTKAVSVAIEEIYPTSPGSGETSPSQLTTVEVRPGTSAVVPLLSFVAPGSPTPFGLELRATGPVLVTGSLLPVKAGLQAAVESGVPAGSS
ncbi:MAG: hypothetical protein ACLQK4_15330 [Acidimicrobiales bacterium]|jgi:hypothetical protein